MTTKRTIVIVAAAVGLTLAVGAVGAVSAFKPQVALYAAAIAGEGGHFGGRHQGGAWRGRGLNQICGHDHDERIDELIAFVDSFVDFTPEQAAAWADLTGALRASGDSVDAICDELIAAGKPATAPEAAARIETVMAAGLEVVRELRPPFDAFYAALDAEQRAALDGLVNTGHRH